MLVRWRPAGLAGFAVEDRSEPDWRRLYADVPWSISFPSV
jgi:hypothetical protein